MFVIVTKYGQKNFKEVSDFAFHFLSALFILVDNYWGVCMFVCVCLCVYVCVCMFVCVCLCARAEA